MSLGLLDLMNLHSKAATLSIDSPVDDFVPLFKLFGVDDVNLIAKVQGAALAVSNTPAESVLAFMQNGGLIRLFAAANGNNPSEEEDEAMLIRCPHCEEEIVL